MIRSEIRYALFRCRSGNPTPSHQTLLNLYRPLMDDLHLDIHDFGDAWDIGQVAPFESIVTGGRLMLLQEARDGSVVNKDGTPADVMVAAAAKKLGIEPFIPQTPQIPAEELLAVQVAAEKAEQDRIALEATAALAASKKKK